MLRFSLCCSRAHHIQLRFRIHWEKISIADKYSRFAPFYDLLSAEFPIYRAGRALAIDMLSLHPGEQVLDVGCGTGLNFGLIQQKIGASGMIVGIDRSPQMLAQARRRATRNGWSNVILIEADATTLSAAGTGATISAHGGALLSQVALATYALSLMPNWESAWANMLQMSSYGARMGVVDMQIPTGRASLLAPLAKAACRLGGADINAHPWNGVERDCDDVESGTARGGHIQVRTGRCR